MLAGGLVVCLCSIPLLGAEDGSEQDLPGYYEFFAKTGKLTRLDSEVKRDEAVKAGKIVPVPMNQPLPDLRLPFRDHIAYGLKSEFPQDDNDYYKYYNRPEQSTAHWIQYF